MELEKNSSVPNDAGVMRIVGSGLKSRYTIGKAKGELMRDLNLAQNEIASVEQKDSDACLIYDEEGTMLTQGVGAMAGAYTWWKWR